jgi:hypothetical protein
MLITPSKSSTEISVAINPMAGVLSDSIELNRAVVIEPAPAILPKLGDRLSRRRYHHHADQRRRPARSRE